jgi:hypothetical protein
MVADQGIVEDAAEPPNQTEVTVETLRRNGNAVGYLPLTGGQHDFRQAANVKRYLDAELTVYAVEVVPLVVSSASLRFP